MCASPSSGIKPSEIFIVFTFPATWPPARPEELISKIDEAIKTTITAHEDGHLSLTIQTPDQFVEHHFRKIRLSGAGGKAILYVAWAHNGGPSCSINDQELKLRESDSDEILHLTLKPVIVQPTAGIHFSQAALDRMPELERFFLHTLQDIEQKLAANDSYKLIRLSGLIRHLLLDKQPLLHKVNVGYGLELQFPVSAGLTSPARDELHELLHHDGQTLLHAIALFPNGAPSIEITLDEFLRTKCLWYRGIDITVKNVIRTIAHIRGGVHTGEAKDEVDETLLSLEREITTESNPLPLDALKDIARVVNAAATPLVHAIHKRYGA
ncbi:MAG: hypothetical protein WC208_05000 [Gallionella sp.]|jgi:hypothetical protein